MGQTELGWTTVEDCMPDLKLSWSSEGDLGHSRADDVLGNTTKQYNPHLNLYFTHVNLPHSLLSQEYFVCFSSTSPHASSAEQFAGLETQLWQVRELYSRTPACVAMPVSVVYRDM